MKGGNERNKREKGLTTKEMNQKGQLGSGHGVFGLPIGTTRIIAGALIIFGLILFIVFSSSPMREIGFFLAATGGLLFVIYR